MNCHRCDGLMIGEQCSDFAGDTGQYGFNAWRCLLCGEIVDPLILNNRAKTPSAIPSPKKTRPRHYPPLVG